MRFMGSATAWCSARHDHVRRLARADEAVLLARDPLHLGVALEAQRVALERGRLALEHVEPLLGAADLLALIEIRAVG